MEEFERILLPTDGSPNAEPAVMKGLSLAKLLKRPVLGIYVIDAHSFEPYPQEGVILDLKGILEEEGKKALAALQKRAKKLGVEVQTKLLYGHPEEEIVKAADPDDLIVMSTHGRRGLTRFLLGSVAETVVRLAPCPVLVIRKAKG